MLSNFHLTSIDIVAIAVLAFFGALGAWRGFMKEILSIAGWAAASFALFFGFVPLQPVTRDFVHNTAIADFITGALLFAGTLIVVSFIAHFLSKWIKDSALGGANSMLGFVFGLAQGTLIICLGFFLYSAAQPDPDEYPDNLKNAASLRYIQNATEFIVGLVQNNAASDDAETPSERAQQKIDENNQESEYKEIEKDGLEPPAP